MKRQLRIDYDLEMLNRYKKILAAAGALSDLFSDSEVPFLHYRIAENAFCYSFRAENISRDDCAIDAALNKYGIGIKTFINHRGSSMQKIAEFDAARSLYDNMSLRNKILKISEMRNMRILSSNDIYGANRMIYHCIARSKGMLHIYETEMDLIDVMRISDIKERRGSITFADGKNEYAFNPSKSTLFKRFMTPGGTFDIEVTRLKDPFEYLRRINTLVIPAEIKVRPSLVLPLYSGGGENCFVPPKSGLNQWNAGGRARHEDEVYIRIPSEVRNALSDYFPPRDKEFVMKLPNGRMISGKVCQDGNKALMSNPNKDLGHWILRDVLKVKSGELCSYNTLLNIGIDSVILFKNADGSYDLDFASVGNYERFRSEGFKYVKDEEVV